MWWPNQQHSNIVIHNKTLHLSITFLIVHSCGKWFQTSWEFTIKHFCLKRPNTSYARWIIHSCKAEIGWQKIRFTTENVRRLLVEYLLMMSKMCYINDPWSLPITPSPPSNHMWVAGDVCHHRKSLRSSLVWMVYDRSLM